MKVKWLGFIGTIIAGDKSGFYVRWDCGFKGTTWFSYTGKLLAPNDGIEVEYL